MSAPLSDTLVDVTKDKLIQLRVTSDERARWQAAADADKRTLSDWLRVVADKASEPAKPKKRRG